MENKKKNNKKVLLAVIGIIAIVAIILGASYGYWLVTKEQTGENELIGGCINLDLSDEGRIKMDSAYPMTDENGKLTPAYKFTITNTCELVTNYIVNLEVMPSSTEKPPVDPSLVRIQFNNEVPTFLNENPGDKVIPEATLAKKLGSGTLKPNESVDYTVKQWIHETASEDISGQVLITKVTVTGSADPLKPNNNIIVDLDSNMIPIMYKGTAWVKADQGNHSDQYKWYAYDSQQWANAVIVKADKVGYYAKASIGEEIKENDILAYYVYIPRYKYELFNVDGKDGLGPREIKVEFETKDTKQSCGGNPESGDGCDQKDRIYDSGINGRMLTHPAFTFGDTELNGIWVGKFETSAEGICNTTPNAANCDTNATNNTARILPGKNSWRYISLSKAFTISSNIKTTYGLNSTKTDSHMMKNIEWGAVAYLSQSKYGKYGNSNYYTDGKPGPNSEIYINNRLDNMANYKSITGCSAGVPSKAWETTCLNPFPETTLESMGASTTGTLYGIYDMSGGAAEYVMGNMAATNENYLAHTMNQQSAGTTFGTYTNVTLPKKYYDIYDTGTNIQHNRGKLGDATKEILATYGELTGGWYGDVSYFVESSAPWGIRGSRAHDNMIAGIFAFSRSTGVFLEQQSFRAVLVHE